jgi:hypothetical protein
MRGTKTKRLRRESRVGPPLNYVGGVAEVPHVNSRPHPGRKHGGGVGLVPRGFTMKSWRKFTDGLKASKAKIDQQEQEG